MKQPELNEGEIYAGAIINPDGTGHHVILLDGDNNATNWDDATEWAQSIGDLPDRVEQALLYKRLPEQFKKDWYWSNETHAADSDFAWCQGFYGGGQPSHRKGGNLRARSVRRVVMEVTK